MLENIITVTKETKDKQKSNQDNREVSKEVSRCVNKEKKIKNDIINCNEECGQSLTKKGLMRIKLKPTLKIMKIESYVKENKINNSCSN